MSGKILFIIWVGASSCYRWAAQKNIHRALLDEAKDYLIQHPAVHGGQPVAFGKSQTGDKCLFLCGWDIPQQVILLKLCEGGSFPHDSQEL